jgi:hypothetical protein
MLVLDNMSMIDQLFSEIKKRHGPERISCLSLVTNDIIKNTPDISSSLFGAYLYRLFSVLPPEDTRMSFDDYFDLPNHTVMLLKLGKSRMFSISIQYLKDVSSYEKKIPAVFKMCIETLFECLKNTEFSAYHTDLVPYLTRQKLDFIKNAFITLCTLDVDPSIEESRVMKLISNMLNFEVIIGITGDYGIQCLNSWIITKSQTVEEGIDRENYIWRIQMHICEEIKMLDCSEDMKKEIYNELSKKMIHWKGKVQTKFDPSSLIPQKPEEDLSDGFGASRKRVKLSN